MILYRRFRVLLGIGLLLGSAVILTRTMILLPPRPSIFASVVRVTGEVVGGLEDEGPALWQPAIFHGDHARYVCSGMILRLGRVLTAAHCAPRGSMIQVDGRSARIVREDDYYDLALLVVNTGARSPVMLSDRVPQSSERLTAIGYAFGWDRAISLEERLLLINFSPREGIAPGLLVQHGYVGGMSGGPVIDAQGNVLGVVQQSQENVGYGVGVQFIRAFLVGEE